MILVVFWLVNLNSLFVYGILSLGHILVPQLVLTRLKMQCPMTSYGLQTPTFMKLVKNQYIILDTSSDEFCTHRNKNIGFKANFHLRRSVKFGCTTQFLSASNLTFIRTVPLSISSTTLQITPAKNFRKIWQTFSVISEKTLFIFPASMC